ncbi:sperm associated antigen 8 [Cololabis saira]|uniref:sperm associated antigen 8 n=1 Tax=Cololabis saira TaxID=129043 RepID=UPI002AD326FE|nr:sperm associated antigen 8 [Cololabis saira]
MTERSVGVKSEAGEGPVSSCVEERETQGEREFFTVDQNPKMETITMSKATYVAHKSPGEKMQGTRREFLQKHFSQMMREKLNAELNQPISKTDYQSTTQRDFCMQGFVPCRPPATQGVTATQNLNAPFGRSAKFSTPIRQRLDDPELPPDN